jgi:hypothetical protein
MSSEIAQRVHDRWRLRSFRRAYTRVSGYRSPTPGYAGLLDELGWGLEHLDPHTRERADEAVLRVSFYGELAIAGLELLGRRTRLQARLLAAASPLTLRFLVGEIVLDADNPRVNRLPSCRFRREGGERMCREVCREPTEAFTRARRLPVLLEPERAGHGCHWTWGQARTEIRDVQEHG